MRILIALSLLASSNASAEWVIPGYGKSPLAAAEAFTLRPHGRDPSCAEVLSGAGQKGATTGDVIESAKRQRDCEALRLLIGARPPTTPTLNGFALSARSLDELPPCFAPVFSPDHKAAVPEAGKSWRASSQQARVISAEGGMLRVADDGYSAVLRIAGRGDVNGDGVEDVVLRSDWKLAQGTMGGSTTFVFTKKRGAKVLEVVSDSARRCSGSAPPPEPCSPAVTRAFRAEFQRRFDAKDYLSADLLLDGYLAACQSEVAPLARSWMRNDQARAAHRLADAQRCLELAQSAGLQDVSTPEEARLQSAVEENLRACGDAIIKATWVGYCEGNPETARIVSIAEAPGATAPFCVELISSGFDPLDMKGAEVEVPEWESMAQPMLLIESGRAKELIVTIEGERAIGKCKECDGGCFKLARTEKFKKRQKVHAPHGRALLEVGALVGDWTIIGVQLHATVEAPATGGRGENFVSLANWPWCM